MKGLPRYLNTLAFFHLAGLCVTIVNVISIEAQSTDAEKLLNIKVEELNRFVQAVEENSRNCSALEGCSGSSQGCSRSTCYEFGKQGDSNYKCVKVRNNFQACDRTTCTMRNFDYSRAFVRSVVNSPTFSRTVCTHRTLDLQFKNSSMNNSSRFFRAFFGAVDGTTRIYPGVDEDDCNSSSTYDPRTRPWYIQSTFVPKVVTILLDSGSNMQQPTGIPNDKDRSYLDKAKTMVLKFLGTLQDGIDSVNIMSFDSSRTTSVVNATKSNFTAQQQKFNDSLSGIEYKLNSDPNATHISEAINTAISSQLNQILFDISSFKSIGRLPTCNPASRAFSENIPDEIIGNPLYALQSYYSFLARIHRDFCYGSSDTIDYSTVPYADHSGVDNNTLRLSKAAFGQNGELLGVVAIDIFQERFTEQHKTEGLTFDHMVIAATIRHQGLRDPYGFNTSKDLSTSVCFNSTENCPGRNNSVSDFLCNERTGSRSIGCCVDCINTTASNVTIVNATAKGPQVAKILEGVAGGVVGLLVIAAIGFFTWPYIDTRTEKEGAESPEFIFPGPENGESVPITETFGRNGHT